MWSFPSKYIPWFQLPPPNSAVSKTFFPTCISTWSGPRPERLEVVLSRPFSSSWRMRFHEAGFSPVLHCVCIYIAIYMYIYICFQRRSPTTGFQNRFRVHTTQPPWIKYIYLIYMYIYTCSMIVCVCGSIRLGTLNQRFLSFKAPNKEVLTFNHVCQRCGWCSRCFSWPSLLPQLLPASYWKQNTFTLLPFHISDSPICSKQIRQNLVVETFGTGCGWW